MREQYAAIEPWKHEHGYRSGDRHTVDVYSADACDRQGNVWREFAWSVRIHKVPGFASRRFFGESAWSDADRLALDAHQAYVRSQAAW